MEKNQLLLFYEKELRNLLRNDQLFVVKLKSENIININDLNEDINEYLEDEYLKNILCIKTSKFLNILYDLGKKLHLNLRNKIINTWEFLINEKKLLIQQELSTISKFPFINYIRRNSIVNFENIISPIVIRSRKNVKNEDELINKVCQDDLNFIDYLQPSDRLLITGEAGIGKTYHFMKILNEWANNKQLINYLLLNINLNDINSNENLEETLFNQNFKNNNKITKNLLDYYLSNKCEDKNRRIILLIDGANELRYDNSIFNNVIEKSKQIDFPIIVWSRKWKADQIKGSYNYIFEIVGYNDEHVRLFFGKYFKEELNLLHEKDDNRINTNDTNAFNILERKRSRRESLIEYLYTKQKDLLKLCSNPLIAVITARIWRENKQLLKLDKFSIYDVIIEILIKKSIENNDMNESYSNIIKFCSKLAFFNLILNIPMIIDKDEYDINKYGNLLIPFNYERNNQIILKFIHFSFQEYFTALFVVDNLKMDYKCRLSDISCNENISDKERLIDIICHNKNLLKLKHIFDFIRGLDKDIFTILVKTNPDILAVSENCISEEIMDLIRFRQNNYRLKLDCGLLSTITWKILINCLSNQLKIIHLINVDNIDFEELIKSIINHTSGYLQELYIKSNNPIQTVTKTYEEIIENCPGLLKVNFMNIHFVKDKYFDNFEIISNNLEHLSLSNGCLSQNLPTFLFCCNLNFIDFSYNNFTGKFQSTSLRDIYIFYVLSTKSGKNL